MIVSDVGRTTSGSVNALAGRNFPSASVSNRVWVTHSASLPKPSTCSASLAKK